MIRRLALAATLCLALLPLGACTRPPDSQPAAPTDSGAPPAAVAPIKAMTIEQKQQLVAENFQPEVPVPFGEVIRGQAQGNNAWDYELVVDAPPASVASWYQDAYLGREWQLAEQTSPSPGAFTLTLVKNAAQTRVTITPEGEGKSRVKAVLGVGAPVLQTQ